MALYKILVLNGKYQHTFSGLISGEYTDTFTVSGNLTGKISGVIKDTISGYIYGVNYVAENLKTYSGVASGLISGQVSGEISGEILGSLTETKSITHIVSGVLSDKYYTEGYSFIKKDDESEWLTTSRTILKEKLLELYKLYPQNIFIPVHILEEEFNILLDECEEENP
jgi:hypothetical protein